MNRLYAIPVPDDFFKHSDFRCTEEEIKAYYKDFKGYMEEQDVTFVDIDVEATAKFHSGDSRIWLKNGMYDNPVYTAVIMEMDQYDYPLDIYDWLKDNIPSLYQKHIDYDTKIIN